MQEVFAKIIERLEEEKRKGHYDFNSVIGEKNVWQKSIEIVKQEAEEFGTDTNVRSNGWIPVSDGLPKIYEESMSSDIMLVLGHDKAVDYYWQAMGWYSETAKKWFFAECKNTDKQIDWIDIIAWQPLPAPYQPKGE